MTVATDPVVVAELVERAGRSDFDRWAEQLAGCGHCARPVRLRGTVRTDGQRTYTTAGEPDRVLLKRCGNRRAAVCPSCSYEYAGDLWQLLFAGAAGGRKGVPDTVAAHPLVFATLTAPSFGTIHGTRTGRTGQPARCRPARGTVVTCRHGRPTTCGHVHREDDEQLGQPLCPDCYDYAGHVAFNWHAPELWRRFTIALRRALAKQAGMRPRDYARYCRPSFVKVAEFQRRAVVHFHAIIRLDGPEEFTPPAIPTDPAELADAIREAAARVSLLLPQPDGRSLPLFFGDQIDTRPVHVAGELTPERVAAYIAKYATKSAEDFGLGDRRQTPAALVGHGLSEHVARLVRTCWDLGAHDEYAGLRRWVHMLGFRGHFASKSRRYSTTLGAIREERHIYRTQHGDDTTLVVSHWTFAGLGYPTAGDALLAQTAAAKARELRRTTNDERTTSTSDYPLRTER